MAQIDWSQPISQSLHSLIGTTGTLAIVNLVPLVVTAGRNNPLISFLMVSFDTFNLLHRWCARMVVFEATIHTLCWAVNGLRAGGMYQIHIELSTSKSYAFGLLGTVAFGCIFIQAFSPLRHAFYETFLNGHRILVVVALVGVYVHIDAANLPQRRERLFLFHLRLFLRSTDCTLLVQDLYQHQDGLLPYPWSEGAHLLLEMGL